ncbi:unnamed protein product [Adineta steineri]|uniref:Uncharacterized protein n=1 Tax=Adineta steineri TaxID=433720 RepID=A0A819FIJ6_9BILA|nr:unnamed protein product [Adineta steineri]CAF3869493.1 unnamed protein product [Adineta steineri]
MMNRIVLNSVVRIARVNPTTRSIAPYRWQSSSSQAAQGATKTAANPAAQGASKPAAPKPAADQAGQGSNFTAGLAGGLTVLLGGFAWYHFSGTRQVVNTARDGVKKAEELKEKIKDKAGDPAETVKYLRSASAALIPGSAPFLGKIFDQVEHITKEHGDEVKKVFEETYGDFEKLAKEGSLDPKTAGKAVDILQKRVKQIQELAGDAGSEAFNKIISENPELRDKVADQYKNLKEVIEKAKDKKPEAQKLLKETGTELAKIFTENGVSKQSIKQAQDLLKKKGEEAKKLVDDAKKK